ncbi:MAG: hypothetical protein Q9187_006602 [Circinaria calcarea]
MTSHKYPSLTTYHIPLGAIQLPILQAYGEENAPMTPTGQHRVFTLHSEAPESEQAEPTAFYLARLKELVRKQALLASLFEEEDGRADFLENIRHGNKEIAGKIDEVELLLASANEEGLDDFGLPI